MEDIRFAKPEDAEAILGLLRLMHAEIGLATLSEAKTRGQIAACLDRGMIILAIDEGRIVGTMGLMCVQPWYSEDWMLSETWTFVHPDFRRSPHAKRMLEASKLGAVSIKLPLTVAVVSDQRTAGKVRLFARHLQHIGAVFYQPYPAA